MGPTATNPTGLRRRRGRFTRSRGFTLIEAALTTVIVGTGVLAIVAAQQAYHAKNQWAVRTGTGMLLANELRELTMAMPYTDPQGGGVIGPEEAGVALWDDLDDFAGSVDAEGTSFAPPINALREEIPDMEGWRQHVKVEAVFPDNISVTSNNAPRLDVGDTLRRVTVDVYYKGPNDAKEELVTLLSWIVVEQ